MNYYQWNGITKEDWKLPIHRSAVIRDKQEINVVSPFHLNERSYLVCSESLLISFYRTDCDVGGWTEAVGWIKAVLAVK